MSSRWSRAAASARARGSSAASRATTRTACRRRPRRPRTIAAVAWSATRRRGCALPAAERQARGPGEDCIACHMPRPAVTNIPHTAATDHRIPRGAPGPAPESPRGAPGQPGEIPADGLPLGSDDRGGAAGRRARPGRGPRAGRPGRLSAAPQLAKVAATQAVPLLEAARPRPSRRPARPRIPRARPGDPGPSARRRSAPSKRSSASNPAASWPSVPPAALLAGLQRPDLARAALREGDRGQSLAVGLSPGAGPGLRPGRRLARGRRGLPRGDPAQPRAVRGAVAAGPGLPAVRRADEGRRRVPDPAPLLPRQPRGLAAMVRAAEVVRVNGPRSAAIRARWTPGRPGRNRPGRVGRVEFRGVTMRPAPMGCSCPPAARPRRIASRTETTGRTNLHNWSDQSEKCRQEFRIQSLDARNSRVIFHPLVIAAALPTLDANRISSSIVAIPRRADEAPRPCEF